MGRQGPALTSSPLGDLRPLFMHCSGASVPTAEPTKVSRYDFRGFLSQTQMQLTQADVVVAVFAAQPAASLGVLNPEICEMNRSGAETGMGFYSHVCLFPW